MKLKDLVSILADMPVWAEERHVVIDVGDDYVDVEDVIIHGDIITICPSTSIAEMFEEEDLEDYDDF